jgi:hypothetical protein
MNGDGTNFIRNDAMLVILIVGNGNDTSRVNLCDRGDTVMVPCDTLGHPACSSTDMSTWGAAGQTCSSGTLSLNYYKSAFASLKASAAMMRVYAAVSSYRVLGGGCQGANADVGDRYQQMASAFQGKSFNICDGQYAVTSALSQLEGALTTIRLSLRTRYLQISQEPEVSSIVVTRSDGVVIPQSSTNGWTYAGNLTDAYAIDYPVPMNQFSGYAIELHGTYKLTGSQSANVSYTQKGLHSTD